MSSESILQRLGPQTAALIAAGGSAASLLAVAVFLPTGSTVFYAVLALVPVDFAFMYFIFGRAFEQA
ncbi:hypothetical protein [Haloarchaeobius baliensis]|uniref:hypothetical protein n=1 Tax=Haloarchaeobius baliensis TaxID=1670458 RepID=UPI003F88491E